MCVSALVKQYRERYDCLCMCVYVVDSYRQSKESRIVISHIPLHTTILISIIVVFLVL